MHKGLTILSLLFILLLLPMQGIAQEEGIKYKIRNNSIKMVIDLNYFRDHSPDTILSQFGLTQSELDSMPEEEGRKLLAAMGWEVKRWNNRKLVLVQSLYDMPDMAHKMGPFIFAFNDEDFRPGYPDPRKVRFGYNELEGDHITTTPAGLTRFFLPGYTEAQEVLISGNFNDWSTSGKAMTFVDSGWVTTLDLTPGKYYYKFIIDNHWQPDPNNKKRDEDGHGGYNSIYYVTNYTFAVDTFQKAKVVALSGSFNDWPEKGARMQRTDWGWQLPVYLKDGVHQYKLQVNGEWMLDPTNPVVVGDGLGNFNSSISLGDTFYFHLKGFAAANAVAVAGDFNDWNPNQLFLTRTDDGWEMPYVLAPGNYEYKYLVDGQWMPDPDNPYTNGEGDFTNSVLVIDPNYVFELPGFAETEQAICTGSFNDWSETGYTMQYVEGMWRLPVHLYPGKIHYKFILDGEWMTDPNNDQWENNEHGTGNSILWIESEEARLND